MSESVNILTPVGRLVLGSPWKPLVTDMQGKPLVYKSGPNAGQPKVSYLLGIAIPKTDPEVSRLIQTIWQVAQASFPKLFQGGQCTRPDFAFKYVDGDSQIPDAGGTAPVAKPGFAGHWVFKFQSSFAPTVVSRGGKSVIIDPEQFKRGYYCRIYGSVAGNGSDLRPGVYLNYFSDAAVEMVGYGEEISSGPDPSQVFSTPVGHTPTGMSATPIAPKTQIAVPQQNAAVAQPMAAPLPNPQPAPLPAPAIDYLSGPARTPPVPAAPPAPPAPPQPAVKMYELNGQQYTAEQLKSAGWTDAQIATLAAR